MANDAEEYMPLFIGRYLRDTAELDSLQSGAYLHALMYQWNRGPIPSDIDDCVRLMKIAHQDARSIAASILTRYFVHQTNGTWLNVRCEVLKLDAIARAIRFSKRAVVANERRWQGHTRKYPERRNSRILGAGGNLEMLSILESKKDQSEKLLLQSPSKKESFMDSQMQNTSNTHVIPVLLQNQKQSLSSSLRSEGRNAGVAGVRVETRPDSASQPSAGISPAPDGKAKAKRTPSKSPSGAPKKTPAANRVSPAKKTAGRPKPSPDPAPKKQAANPKKLSRPPDPRFAPFRKEFYRYWRDNHSSGITHPWGARDGAALNRLLKANPHLRLAEFARLLHYRSDSAPELVNVSLAPERWLGTLTEFADGPWKSRKSSAR